MEYNLYTDTNAGVAVTALNLTFDSVCKIIEKGIFTGKTFVIEVLDRKITINDIFDYTQFVEDFS